MKGTHYLDGYNFLFRLHHLRNSLHQLRQTIIEDLAHLAQQRKLHLIVVFDAGYQTQEESRHTHYKALGIVFSSRGQSADEWIVAEVRQSSHPHQITVITSDKDLQRKVKLHGAHFLSVEDFLKTWAKAQKPKKPKPPPELRPLKKEKKEPTSFIDNDYLLIFEKRFDELEKKTPSPPVKKTAFETEYRRWLRLFTEKSQLPHE